MAVRRLTENDREAYADFRAQMWPVYSGAGSWDNVRQKYFDNPLAASCPESGLYAKFHGEAIAGVMGAYPMPITLGGEMHPGHMIVDWAVLPKLQRGLTAALLYRAMLELPGRKFASSGSEDSQTALAGRGHKIHSTQTMAVLRPAQAAIIRRLRVAQYAAPLPLPHEAFEIAGLAQHLPEQEILPPAPAEKENTAYVNRDASYWAAFCRYRDQNGTVALRLADGHTQLQVLLKVLEVGQFSMASLLGATLEAGTPAAAGKLVRKLLDRLNVAVLMAGQPDETGAELLAGVCPWKLLRRSQRVHWWVLPKPSDDFAHDEVDWWLTLADRDSVWGLRQPDATQRGGRHRKQAA